MTLLDDLTALETLVNELGALDTQLSSAITFVEEALRTRIAVRISTPFRDGALLVFGKINGHWRLLIERGDNREALASCSRGQRVEVFRGRHIEQLIADARAQVTEQIDTRIEALAAAAKLSELLGGGS